MPGKHKLLTVKSIEGKDLEFKTENDSILVSLQNNLAQIDYIVVMELDGSAMDINDITLTSDKKQQI